MVGLLLGNLVLETPVAFIIFNRPDTTERVFAEIAKARPTKLFVIADGPRADRPGEAEKCAAARAVIDRVDWECEVLRNYADVNLGCRQRPPTGISWVFEQVAEAIILEDDCVPQPTFFRFCEELLEKYRDDERVMHIGGSNFQLGHIRGPFSYYFSRYNPIWGWATWRRAWQHYDVAMKLWPELRDTSWLLDIQGDPRAAETLRNIFDRTYAGLTDTWDHQWNYTCWTQNGLAILPNINLVCNIGFGDDSTHLKSASNRLAYLPTQDMVFPLQHPPYVVRDTEADQLFMEQYVPHNQRNRSHTLGHKIWVTISKALRKSLTYVRSLEI